MSGQLPPDIKVEQLAQGTRWRLPKPQLGLIRLGGLAGVMFGFMFSGFAVFWMVMASGAMYPDDGQFQPAGLAFMLFGVPFFFVGMALLIGGLFVLAGRYDIEIRNENLYSIVRLGPLRLSRKRLLEKVDGLKINSPIHGRYSGHSPNSQQTGVLSALAGLAGLCNLTAEGRHIAPLILAGGYPPGWLEDLAGDLAERLGRGAPGRLMRDGAKGVQIVNQSPEGAASGGMSNLEIAEFENSPRQVIEQPFDSLVTFEQRADGPTLFIPPAGIWRGSRGLLSFSLVWNGIVGVITTVFVLSALGVIPMEGDPISPFAALFLVPFLAVGVIAFVSAINMGRRRAIIDVVYGTLLISRKNLFGTRQHEWSADELKDIRVGSSGMEVNNVPIMELQIRPAGGKKLGLFGGRDTDELRWMASVLRDALGLDKRV